MQVRFEFLQSPICIFLRHPWIHFSLGKGTIFSFWGGMSSFENFFDIIFFFFLSFVTTFLTSASGILIFRLFESSQCTASQPTHVLFSFTWLPPHLLSYLVSVLFCKEPALSLIQDFFFFFISLVHLKCYFFFFGGWAQTDICLMTWVVSWVLRRTTCSYCHVVVPVYFILGYVCTDVCVCMCTIQLCIFKLKALWDGNSVPFCRLILV